MTSLLRALVSVPKAPLPFENHRFESAPRQLARAGQADDAGTDDHRFDAFHCSLSRY
jgi:hypothetical protein